MPMLHPNDRALLSMAQDELPASELDAMIGHLFACARCRNQVRDVRELIDRTNSEATPDATEALLMRIQRSRAAGARMILADVSEEMEVPALPMQAGGKRWSTAAVAAAAVVVLSLVSAWPRPGDARVTGAGVASNGGVPDSAPDSDGLLGGLSPWPAVAYAQAAPAAASTGLPALDLARVAPAEWTTVTTYSLGDTLSGVRNTTGTSIEAMMHRGIPAWRLVTSMSMHARWTDTLIVRRSDLRPLVRHWHIDSRRRTLHIEQRYGHGRADRLVTVRREVVTGLAPRVDSMVRTIDSTGLLLVNDAQLEVLLLGAVLSPKWSLNMGSPRSPLGVTSVEPQHTIRVDGEEVLRTPWAKIPVWRIVFSNSPGTARNGRLVWYVNKENGQVVRTSRPGHHWNARGEIDDRVQTELVSARRTATGG